MQMALQLPAAPVDTPAMQHTCMLSAEHVACTMFNHIFRCTIMSNTAWRSLSIAGSSLTRVCNDLTGQCQWVQAEIERVQKRREEREAEKARMEEELVSLWLDAPTRHS